MQARQERKGVPGEEEAESPEGAAHQRPAEHPDGERLVWSREDGALQAEAAGGRRAALQAGRRQAARKRRAGGAVERQEREAAT